MRQNSFLIITKIKDYIKLIDGYVANIPKKDLYIKNKIYNTSFDLIEKVFELNETDIKKERHLLLAKLNTLDFLFEFLYCKKYISSKQLEKIAYKLLEINKMIGAWLKKYEC